MFIHFAFGELAKQGKISEQTNEVIERILETKQLKVSPNTEFLPSYPLKGRRRLPFDGSTPAPDDGSIYYIQSDVPMICFIKIPFHELKSSNHPKQYGKFGIVLSTDYLLIKGIKPVTYYTEKELWHDKLVRKFNALGGGTKELQDEILTYRKPSTYFPNFRKSVQLRIHKTVTETTVSLIKYDRYPENYNFRQENEHRISFQKDEKFMVFTEKDMYMIITPDFESCSTINSYLNRNWAYQPIVKIFPS